jgi:hypothetical protein
VKWKGVCYTIIDIILANELAYLLEVLLPAVEYRDCGNQPIFCLVFSLFLYWCWTCLFVQKKYSMLIANSENYHIKCIILHCRENVILSFLPSSNLLGCYTP